MKKNTYAFRQSLPLTQLIFWLISLTGFTYPVMADQQITDAEILRVAKIAKATGTNITIIKETTTVKVYGNNKKTNKKVKKTVLRLIKQKNSPELNQSTVYPHEINKPPVLESSNVGNLQTPVLEDSGMY
jgi:hypothetical protein